MARLILIDDDESNLLTLEAILEDEGYLVTCCSNRAAVMAVLQQETEDCDLAIVDRGLGRDDGLDLVPLLQERWPGVRIVIFSGREVPRELPPGVALQLAKGGDVEELLAALRSLSVSS